MAQHLGELPPHSENLSSVLNNQDKQTIIYNSSFRGVNALFGFLRYIQTHHTTHMPHNTDHTHIYTQPHTQCAHTNLHTEQHNINT